MPHYDFELTGIHRASLNDQLAHYDKRLMRSRHIRLILLFDLDKEE